MSIPPQLQQELLEKAARHAAWVALVLAQCAGWDAVAHQMTTIVVAIDALRETSERTP